MSKDNHYYFTDVYSTPFRWVVRLILWIKQHDSHTRWNGAQVVMYCNLFYALKLEFESLQNNSSYCKAPEGIMSADSAQQAAPIENVKVNLLF